MKPAVLSFILITIMSLQQTSSAQSGGQSAQTLHVQISVRMNYLLYLPSDYEQRESCPLVLFLHGAGERGGDLELVKKHGPPKLVAQGQEFPFILVSPQCREDVWWEPTELTALLDSIVASHRIDRDRIYVTGLSMGGFGTWRLAAFTPDRFAAIAPICGGGEAFWAKRIAKLPTWVFHGAKDRAVPLERSEKMVAAIEKESGSPKFTVYPEVEHDSWTQTYDNPEFYSWLLAQRRASSSK